MQTGGDTFLGRTEELEVLDRALDDAASGRGALAMLVGEPGIGKTHTAAELARRAGIRGFQVLWGECYEREGAPPYWPWVQAFRAHVQSVHSELLREQLGPGAAEVARVLTDVAERLPDLAPPAVRDARQGRFRFYDSTTAFLRRVTVSRPLLVVLDDVHAADGDSLLLLEFVARELATLRTLLVVTYRDVALTRKHPLARTLAELSRIGVGHRITLRGLPREDVQRFLEIAYPGKGVSELADAVYSRTDGNPLFVAELVRSLRPGAALGAPTRPGDTVEIPEGIRDVIRQRIEAASLTSQRVLTLAAVAGRNFRFDQLSAFLEDLTEDELVDAVEETVLLRIVDELGPGEFQFAHALIRETLLEELSTTRRARLHAHVAQALERLYGTEAARRAAELAYHFGEAASVLGEAQLAHYLRVAGETALEAHAFEEAAGHLGRALAASERRAIDDETAGILVSLARAELGARELYELGDALERLCRAFEYYESAGDRERAVRVAAQPIPPVWEPTKFRDVVERALALVPEDAPEASQLLATAGWFRSTHDRSYEAGEEAFKRSFDIARRHEDDALLRRTLVTAAHADYWHLRWSKCRDRGLEATELAARAGDQHTEMIAREWPARVLGIEGKPALAKAHATAAVKLAEKLGERAALANSCMYSSWLYALEGDWTHARELSDRALALQPREPRNVCTRALMELQTGAFDTGTGYLEQLLDPIRVTRWSLLEQFAMAAFIPMAARITGDRSQLKLARDTALRALAAEQMPPFMHLYGRIGLAFVAVEANDEALAREQYAAFESQRGTAIVMAGIVVDRLLGLLAISSGNVRRALAHFEEGLAFCRRANYRPEWAWTTLDLALALHANGIDPSRVRALQDEACALAEELDMQPLAERARASLSARVI
jgi:tetratricopeptide (TPR) repeat protein